jgi:hypothetical protein
VIYKAANEFPVECFMSQSSYRSILNNLKEIQEFKEQNNGNEMPETLTSKE